MASSNSSRKVVSQDVRQASSPARTLQAIVAHVTLAGLYYFASQAWVSLCECTLPARVGGIPLCTASCYTQTSHQPTHGADACGHACVPVQLSVQMRSSTPEALWSKVLTLHDRSMCTCLAAFSVTRGNAFRAPRVPRWRWRPSGGRGTFRCWPRGPATAWERSAVESPRLRNKL